MKNNSSAKYKILDLFSGAGGFSYGLESLSEFKSVVANDFNVNAMKTYKYNHPHSEIIIGDITEKTIRSKIINISKDLEVNMIIGGPPCQGFSLQGKKEGLNDPRNFLFREFFNIVKEIKPEIFIIENVKNMAFSNNGYFINQIINLFGSIGYHVNYKIMKSIEYGIPQKRERTIVIGSLKKDILFDVIEKTMKKVTVRDAISDLSYLNSSEGADESQYKFQAKTNYQKTMRKNSKILFNHKATNHSKLALKKLSYVPIGGNKSSIPAHLRGKQKFNSTWSRLKWEEVSPTIDTRFDTPSNGQNTHPTLNRAITPREAARIQTFPDIFKFIGPKTEICKQIGNAVPPLLAKKIGEIIINNSIKEEYIIDKSFLIHADSYSYINDLIKNKIMVDHIITDPPYNISKKNNLSTMRNRRGVHFGDWDEEFDLLGWIGEYNNILKPGGSIIIFCSFMFISHIIDKLKIEGFEIKDCIRWIKSNPMPRNRDRRYVSDYEFAIWGVKPGKKWIFNRDLNIPYLRPEYKSSIVSGKERTKHPTQKSLKVMEDIIKVHTNVGDTIIDPFMGSGTTVLAAKNTNRKYIGIEKNDDYFIISKNRLK